MSFVYNSLMMDILCPLSSISWINLHVVVDSGDRVSDVFQTLRLIVTNLVIKILLIFSQSNGGVFRLLAYLYSHNHMAIDPRPSSSYVRFSLSTHTSCHMLVDHIGPK